MTSFNWRTFRLRELHGPSLFSAEAGWLVELIPDPSCEEVLQQQLEQWSERMLSIVPDLKLEAPVSPTRLSLQVAAQLIAPVEIRAVPMFAHVRVPAEHVLVIHSCLHDLCGDALRCSLMLLRLAQLTSDAVRSGDLETMLAVRDQVRIRADRLTSHPFTNGVFEHADRQGLPLAILDDIFTQSFSLYQVGLASRGHLISSTSVDGDSLIGGQICQNKAKLNALLFRLGYPVPRQVFLPKDCSEQQQITAARRIGYPCVVKPTDAALGFGVKVDIRDDDAFCAAVKAARAHSKTGFVIEQHVSGHYHRLVVVNHQLLRVLRLEPPYLIGDGTRTIAQILESPSSKPDVPGAVMTGAESAPILTADVNACLLQQGWTPSDVLPSGQRVSLEFDLANRDHWIYTECLSEIDPSLRQLATDLSRAVCMSSVGIDILSPDICQNIHQGEFWVIEINPLQRLNPAWAEKFIAALSVHDPSLCIPIAVTVMSCADQWSAVMQFMKEDRRFSQSTIAIPKRLKSSFLEINGFDLVSDQRFLFYGHPREALLNRSVDSLLFVIEWSDFVQSGLPTKWYEGLHLIGSLQPDQQRRWQQFTGELSTRDTPQESMSGIDA